MNIYLIGHSKNPFLTYQNKQQNHHDHLEVVVTWEAKEKLGLGEAPFLLRPTPPPAAWDPFRFRRLFAGLVASKGFVNEYISCWFKLNVYHVIMILEGAQLLVWLTPGLF